MRVLIACECSGTVREAFIAKGHDAWSCDLKPCDDGSLFHITGDAIAVARSQEWDLIIAHPPCTYLTVTGNKWFYHPEDGHLPVSERRPHPRFPDRMARREAAIDLFMQFENLDVPMLAIENPVGRMSTIWRKPDQIINPWQFGHKEPKKTCLWLRGLPLLKHTCIVEPEYHITKSGKRLPKWYAYADKSKGQAHRAAIRSKTFQGIADAMAEQWG